MSELEHPELSDTGIDSEATSPSSGLHRLHASTPLLEIISQLKGWLFPLVLLVFFARGEKETPIWVWIGVGTASMSIVVAFARWITLRYGVIGDQFVIREGLIFRRGRTIPLDRIQNLSLKSGLLHRVFNVVEVRVETAGSGLAEATLSTLKRADAERLRQELRGVAVPAPASAASEVASLPEAETSNRKERLLGKVKLKGLFLAGATETRLGFLFVAAWGLYELVNDLGAEDAVGRLSEEVAASASAPLLATLLVMLALLVGWAASIAWSVVTWFDFALWERKEDLIVRHGLLTRVEAVVPRERIQALQFEATWPRRLFHAWQARLETAGGMLGTEGGVTWLAPWLRHEEVPQVATISMRGLDLRTIELQAVPLRARRRAFVRLLLPVLAASGALWHFLSWPFAVAFLPMGAVLAFFLARASHLALRYALNEHWLVARSGVWKRRLVIVPRTKVQGVERLDSPLQRWLGLATLEVVTAGERLGRVRVRDMAGSEANRIMDLLSMDAASGAAQGV